MQKGQPSLAVSLPEEQRHMETDSAENNTQDPKT